MADARNIRFVLFCAVGAARGAEMRPIENREGRGTLAFDGRHLNNKFNNQPKVGRNDRIYFWETARRAMTIGEAAAASFGPSNYWTKINKTKQKLYLKVP